MMRDAKLKIPIGFVFTDWTLQHLERKNFKFQKRRHSPNSSFVSYCCVLMGPDNQISGFEIRQILDERQYLEEEDRERFHPQILELDWNFQAEAQPNHVQKLVGVLGENELKDSEIGNYLRIRKPFEIWALWLECESFEEFVAAANPDRNLSWQGQRAALIHLGPSCFDLLVTGAKGDS